MREFSLVAALIGLLATTIVLAQEEPAPPATSLVLAEGQNPAGRTNPFAPLAGDAGTTAWPAGASPELTTADAVAAPVRTESSAAPRLNGILYCDSRPLAVISDLIVGLGDEVGGLRVTRIETDRVLLVGPGGTFAMTPLRPEAHRVPRQAAGVAAAPQAEVTGGGPAGSDPAPPADAAAEEMNHATGGKDIP